MTKSPSKRAREYSPGDVVWALFAPYPWWPARVIQPEDVKLDLGDEAQSPMPGEVLVEFFNDENRVGYVAPQFLQPFGDHPEFRDAGGAYRATVATACKEADALCGLEKKRKDVSNKTRSSMAPPENTAYKLRDVVWALVEPYPWWPAHVIRVEDAKLDSDDDPPAMVDDGTLVEFFHDDSRWAVLLKQDLRSYNEENRDLRILTGAQKKAYNVSLKKACAEADNFLLQNATGAAEKQTQKMRTRSPRKEPRRVLPAADKKKSGIEKRQASANKKQTRAPNGSTTTTLTGTLPPGVSLTESFERKPRKQPRNTDSDPTLNKPTKRRKALQANKEAASHAETTQQTEAWPRPIHPSMGRSPPGVEATEALAAAPPAQSSKQGFKNVRALKRAAGQTSADPPASAIPPKTNPPQPLREAPVVEIAERVAVHPKKQMRKPRRVETKAQDAKASNVVDGTAEPFASVGTAATYVTPGNEPAISHSATRPVNGAWPFTPADGLCSIGSAVPLAQLRKSVAAWLEEDCPSFDYAAAVVGSEQRSAQLYVKSSGVIAGIVFFESVFDHLGCNVQWSSDISDGTRIDVSAAGRDGKVPIAVVTGPVRCILQGERVALNAMAECCAIATAAAEISALVTEVGWKGRVAGTRKTTPGFRLVQKYGMIAGGMDSHRMDLSSMIMLKDNHIAAAGSITSAVAAARKLGGFSLKIDVECGSLKDAREAASAGADIVMLDNFSASAFRATAVTLKKEFPEVTIEGSGGLNKETMSKYMIQEADVLSFSVNRHVDAFDMSLKVVPRHA